MIEYEENNSSLATFENESGEIGRMVDENKFVPIKTLVILNNS